MKKQKPPTPEQLADIFGDRYKGQQDQIATCNDRLGEIKDAIFVLAEEHGLEHGKSTLVSGNSYVVGFQTRDPSPEFDKGLFLRDLKEKDKELYLSITTRILDEQKLAYAIAKGKIKQTSLVKYLIKPDKNAKAIRSVSVKPVKGKNASQVTKKGQ